MTVHLQPDYIHELENNTDMQEHAATCSRDKEYLVIRSKFVNKTHVFN